MPRLAAALVAIVCWVGLAIQFSASYANHPDVLVTLWIPRAGQLDDKYPYPFLDVGTIGWTQTVLNIGGIGLGFLLAGLVLVWIDSWRPLGSGRNSR